MPRGRCDFSPVGYQRINKSTGKEVDWAHIVKGYEYERGHYVALSEADLKHANVKASETIEIANFTDTGAGFAVDEEGGRGNVRDARAPPKWPWRASWSSKCPAPSQVIDLMEALRRAPRQSSGDLAGNHGVLVERVNRAEPVIAVGNDELAVPRVAAEQDRRYGLLENDQRPISLDVTVRAAQHGQFRGSENILGRELRNPGTLQAADKSPRIARPHEQAQIGLGRRIIVFLRLGKPADLIFLHRARHFIRGVPQP